MIRHRIAPSLARGSLAFAPPNDYRATAGTQYQCESGAFLRQPLRGPLALARYQSDLRAARAAEPGDRVFVAAVDSSGEPARTGVLAPGQAMVFGRHPQARLRNDAGDISLRHVAIAVAPCSTASAPLLRLWDLRTGRPFETETGQTCEAVTSDGPVFASVGGVHLAVIPLACVPSSAPPGTRALWDSLPRREFVARVAEGSVSRAFDKPCRPDSQPREGTADVDYAASGRGTLVTQMPRAVDVYEEPEVAGAPAIARIELATADGRWSYGVSVERLDRGLLIGRYGRCAGPSAPPAQLSRVHLLIARVGASVMAIDTASTFGSRELATGAPFEAITVGEAADLRLADSLVVRWRWRGPARA